MSKEEKAPVQQPTLDKATPEHLERILDEKLAKVAEMNRKYVDDLLQKSKEYEQRIKEASESAETKLEINQKPVIRDPGEYVDTLLQEHADFEASQGMRPKYKIGSLNFRIHMDLAQGIPLEEVKKIYADEIKNL